MTPTPRTDAVIYEPGEYFSASAADYRRLARQLETELSELREQLEHALNPVHSCGVGCQREACVVRRELEGKLRTARADAFVEAAVICVEVRFCDAGVAKIFLDKAAAIRKGS